MENKLKDLKGKFRVREKKQVKAGDITLKNKLMLKKINKRLKHTDKKYSLRS